MMKTKNLAIYQGDTYLFKVDLTSETGEPLQTDGLSFALAVKFPDGETITPELTVDGNIVSLLLPSAMTAAITHTTAEYDLRAISGQYVKTYLRGQLHITPSITPVTAGEGGEIHEEAVSVTVAEAAIIHTAGNQSQTAYDDSDIKQRLAALEGRQDKDTVFDDSELKRRLAALEGRQDKDTVFDDSELKRRLAALEGRQDKDTVFDDSELKRRLAALEGRQDKDTVYDDSDLKRRLTALESRQDRDTVYDDSDLTIELSTGDRYTLREPLAKDMEGLGQDLIKVKHTDTVQKLLGKISTPPLTRVAYGKLSMSDAQVLNVAIDFFSAPPSAKAEMEAALQDLGYSQGSNSEQTTSGES